jgi:hypothetical protein
MDCKRMVLMELHVRILYMDHFTHQRQLAHESWKKNFRSFNLSKYSIPENTKKKNKSFYTP